MKHGGAAVPGSQAPPAPSSQSCHLGAFPQHRNPLLQGRERSTHLAEAQGRNQKLSEDWSWPRSLKNPCVGLESAIPLDWAPFGCCSWRCRCTALRDHFLFALQLQGMDLPLGSACPSLLSIPFCAHLHLCSPRTPKSQADLLHSWRCPALQGKPSCSPKRHASHRGRQTAPQQGLCNR